MRCVKAGLGASAVTAVLLFTSLETRGQATLAALPQEEQAAQRSVYDNPEIFSQLSGARRSTLELRFGKRSDRGVVYSGEDVSDFFTNPLSPIANVLVNNPAEDTTAQDTQSETAVVVGPAGHVVVAFNDSGSNVGGVNKFTGFSLSTNLGSSFTDQGTLPTNPDGDAGDPVLARSARTGTILLSTLSFNSSNKLMIFRSTNNGASFLPPVNGAPGFTTANGFQDKEWIAVDNFPGPGFGNVYMFWRNFGAGGGMTFTRSLDDGKTWTPNGGTKITNGVGQGASVVVGRDHTVYLFWFDQSVTPFQIKMVKSTNQGMTFTAPVTVTTLLANGSNGDLGLNPGFRTNCFPQAVASPINPNLLFVVYNDHTNTAGGLDRGDIYLRVSANGGMNWGPARKLNDDATRHDQWQPALAITPNGTRLAVAWYDRRIDPANNLIDRFCTIATVVGANLFFGPNFRVTNQAFPAVIGVDPVINPTYMGDYDQMAADSLFFYTTWGDNRDNSTGHAGKNANVRFARISVLGPIARPDVAGVSEEGDEFQEIDVADLPDTVRQALDQAVSNAPRDVVAGPVEWQKAVRFGDTFLMYRLEGQDSRGRAMEAEVKGNRVIELEARHPVDQAPESVITALKTAMPSLEPKEVEVIVVQGKVVSYGFEPKTEPDQRIRADQKTEVYISPEGKLQTRKPSGGNE